MILKRGRNILEVESKYQNLFLLKTSLTEKTILM